MLRSIVAAILFAVHSLGGAQTIVTEDNVPLDEYLRMLEVISPSARAGAESYMAAFAKRCGRSMKTIELRRAVVHGDGDPLLMQMIQAAHFRNTAELQRLGATISCGSS
jgi:hypothetical protein